MQTYFMVNNFVPIENLTVFKIMLEHIIKWGCGKSYTNVFIMYMHSKEHKCHTYLNRFCLVCHE